MATRRAHYADVAEIRDPITGFLVPAANAVLTLYDAGTTTPYSANTYAAVSGGSALANPRTLGSDGRIEFFVDDADQIKSFKIKLSKSGFSDTEFDYLIVQRDPKGITLAEPLTLTAGTVIKGSIASTPSNVEPNISYLFLDADEEWGHVNTGTLEYRFARVAGNTGKGSSGQALFGGATENIFDINGRPGFGHNTFFSRWTNGTSVTADGLSADGWYVAKGSGGSPAFTVSQQSHGLGDIPGEPKFFLRFNQTAQATSASPTLEQRYADVRFEAGKTITIGFYARCSSGVHAMGVRVVQNFGSGGSPSATVNTDAAAGLSITTTWTYQEVTIAIPSISSKIIGSTNGSSYMAIQLRFEVNATFQIDISRFKAERGSMGTEVTTHDRPAAELLSRYVQASSLFAGSTINGGTGVGTPFELLPNQTFTVQRYSSVVEIAVSGSIQVKSDPTGVGVAVAYLIVDGTQEFRLGGQRIQVNGEYSNPFAGSGPKKIPNLTPGDHTYKIVLYCEIAGLVYARGSAFEFLAVDVTEFMGSVVI